MDDVKKPLMAVSDLCSTGHEVVFRQDGGEVKNLATGEIVAFAPKRKVYEAEFEVVPYARVPNGLGAAAPKA